MITTRRIVIPVTTLFLALVALAGAPSALAIRPDPAFESVVRAQSPTAFHTIYTNHWG